MQKLTLLLMLLSFTIPSFASSLRTNDPVVESLVVRRLDASEGAQLLNRWRLSTADGKGTIRPNVVREDRWHHSFAIPSAGHLQGSRGTFFQSDITLSNQNFAQSQLVGIVWLERGVDNSEDPLIIVVELDAGEIVTVRDFVGQLLETTGLGSILFFAIDENFDVDELGSIDGYSRIWTPQPDNAQGTVSQQFPAVATELLMGWDTALAIGIRHDSAFRSNVGIMNLDEVQRTWEVVVVAEDGSDGTVLDVTVPAMSLSHVAVPAGEFGNVVIEYRVVGDATDLEWLAYATSNDNLTGDGWVAIATPQLEDEP